MRIGVAWDVSFARFYRAIFPMKMMSNYGHEVVWPQQPTGEPELNRLSRCDVVHVYRRCDSDALKVFRELDRRGVPLVFDNDDMLAALPRDAPNWEWAGHLHGQRAFAATIHVARLARVMTVTTEPIAEVYRDRGAREVRVLPNRHAHGILRPRHPHDGVVVGWVAGNEHRVDADRLGIARILGEMLERRPGLEVECVGVDLKLGSARYRHVPMVEFLDLPTAMSRYDVGLAPLADNAFNRARSDIKVREYAASGIAWLASAVGPYLPLGPREGGRLVADDEWPAALERMVDRRLERRRLQRRARKWAQREVFERTAREWERVFLEAAA